MALDPQTQNVVVAGGIIGILLLILNTNNYPPVQQGFTAHGYSVAPMASNAACIPCGQGK